MSYIQVQTQKHLTIPAFGIEATGAQAYDTEGVYAYDPEHRRRASIYVFYLYAETDLDETNILNVPAWEFYVLPTRHIDTELGAQKRVGLGTLLSMTEPTGYPALKMRVDEVLSTLQ